ncbi:MAG: hypothetical protein WCJ75_12645 [Desulfomonile sp.]|jgi:hypothetical protein
MIKALILTTRAKKGTNLYLFRERTCTIYYFLGDRSKYYEELILIVLGG